MYNNTIENIEILLNKIYSDQQKQESTRDIFE